MKTKVWKFAAAGMLLMSAIVPMGAQVTEAAAKKYVVLETQWEDGRIHRNQTLYKDGVTYGNFFALGSIAGLRWRMEDDRTAVLERDQKRIVVHMGSRIAEVDGHDVDMGSEPVWYISHLYVPIRFLASALGGEVDHLDPKTGKITATILNNFTDTYSAAVMGYSYDVRTSKEVLEIEKI
ncbi:copper amine oxidase N-terminal domain-containing protein [Paenibacillus lemnae]|uniref:copper amine oxidase N-terminal domain-containing protein n=1 Tax=Paenibacillus lemnae TaxID=1330551 RepID=UPI001FE9502A|nr:copper amine oxidase N-terminal domain-containing protein [Paenibacillus lemnae]